MNVENNSNVGGKSGKTLFPFRYIVTIMVSICVINLFSFEVNVSVAIISMVNHTAVKSSTSKDLKTNSTVVVKVGEICKVLHNMTTVAEDGSFVWDESLQGLILSAYFWGFIVSPLPSGRLAELWSAKWVIYVSILLNIAACLTTPVAAQIHYSLFIVLRFIQGIGGGAASVAIHVIIAKWASPNERSVMTSIIFAGTFVNNRRIIKIDVIMTLGTMICLLLSGVLSTSLSWEFIFYVGGTLGFICSIAWWWLITDSPEESRLISEEERNYILTSLGHNRRNKKKFPVPWKQVLRSKPFIAILISHFCNNFGWYMVLTELPTFMKQILKFDMSSNARLSSVSFLCMWIFTMVLSKVLAVMQNKDLISVTMSRKIATLFVIINDVLIEHPLYLRCLIGVSYVGCNRVLAVALMTIAVTCFGGMYCGFLTNHIDIAPNFAGTLLGMTNCIANIPGFITPICVGKLTRGNQTIEAWRIVFFITVGLYIIEILVYTIFGNCNEQPWNNIELSEETCDQTLPLKDVEEKVEVILSHDIMCT